MQDHPRYAITSSHVVTPDGPRHAVIVVDHGIIQQVLPAGQDFSDVPVTDFGDLVISPGLIDAHVHINDPGTDWEGFESATAAAAAGGITTLVDMPLNSDPVTTTVDALNTKRQAAAGNCWVNVLFYGGLVPGNLSELPGLVDAGVVGIKAFLCDSGLAAFPASGKTELRAAMVTLKSSGVPLLAHAEMVSQASPQPVTDPKSYEQYAASRPPQFELDAIKLLIDLCRQYQTPVHIVHLATAEALPMIRQAKQDGLPLTVETCPHYLYFSQDQVASGDTRFKCAPPIRDEANRRALCEAVAEGWVDTIGSDHSPCPPELKHLESGHFQKAWGGIASLQLLLPATWTAGSPMGWSPLMLAERLSHGPARVLGLASRTGGIQTGLDADLVVWDPDAEFKVDAQHLFHRHAVSPYDGRTLKGVVHRTYVKGQCVYDDGKHCQTELRTGELANHLNQLSSSSKQETLSACCAAQRWVQQMIDHGDFTSDLDVIHHAARVWKTMEPSDWLEAFEAHPRIGDVHSLRKKYASTQTTAAGEQSGCDVADEATLKELAKLNDDYFEKFGFIFIVCATGKSADQMLTLLKQRLTNDRSTELSIAAGQQLDITMLRLRKLVT